MIYTRLTNQSLRISTAIAALTTSAMMASSVGSPVWAQTVPTQMPMNWPMTWGLVAICLLVVVVLILGAAALIKYLFFR